MARACTKRVEEAKCSERRQSNTTRRRRDGGDTTTRDETPRPFGPRPRRNPRRTVSTLRRHRDVEQVLWAGCYFEQQQRD